MFIVNTTLPYNASYHVCLSPLSRALEPTRAPNVALRAGALVLPGAKSIQSTSEPQLTTPASREQPREREDAQSMKPEAGEQ